MDMDKKYLMANTGWLARFRGERGSTTYVSPGLRGNLLTAAMTSAHAFYSRFFGIAFPDTDFVTLVARYEQDYASAQSARLFMSGGIEEADHLNMWSLSNVYRPDVYVESGVFVGGSLHAFTAPSGIPKVFAIDPTLENLRMPTEGMNGLTLIDDRDFSEIDFPVSGAKSLVYFDDHIDTATRIIQAQAKGFRYVLFDDSTGMQGVCQRLFPPVPTIPMISHPELLSPGDELSWTFGGADRTGPSRILDRFVGRPKGTRVTLLVTQELIDRCYAAKELMARCEQVPDLGEFVPQSHPRPTSVNAKFLVELRYSC